MRFDERENSALAYIYKNVPQPQSRTSDIEQNVIEFGHSVWRANHQKPEMAIYARWECEKMWCGIQKRTKNTSRIGWTPVSAVCMRVSGTTRAKMNDCTGGTMVLTFPLRWTREHSRSLTHYTKMEIRYLLHMLNEMVTIDWCMQTIAKCVWVCVWIIWLNKQWTMMNVCQEYSCILKMEVDF